MIYIANDHGGVKLKEKIVKYLSKIGVDFVNLGTNEENSVSYVNYAKTLCNNVLENSSNKGILICKNGIGMSIVANRFKGIRAGLCKDKNTAKLCRKHNNCNVLVLSSKTKSVNKVVDAFLTTSFDGGRHEERINSIDD